MDVLRNSGDVSRTQTLMASTLRCHHPFESNRHVQPCDGIETDIFEEIPPGGTTFHRKPKWDKDLLNARGFASPPNATLRSCFGTDVPQHVPQHKADLGSVCDLGIPPGTLRNAPSEPLPS